MEEEIPNQRQRIHKILRRYVLLTVIVSVIFFTAVLAFFMSDRSAQNESVRESTQIERISRASQAPSVEFAAYALATALPRARTSANSYVLKESFSQKEIEGIASKFGLQISQNNADDFAAINFDNPEKMGALIFDASTGAFEYTSYGVYKPENATSPRALAESSLKDFGVFDEFTNCSITYQRTDTPDTTFVECHRDWARFGAPLVNLGGVLNLPETASLSRLVAGVVDGNTPEDPAVTNVSNGGNGRARPNDFNTATVAVRDGRVVSVVSNLRWLEAIEGKTIITPAQALSLFQNRQAQFSLTVPAGSGFTEWGKVYTDNKAVGESAIVSDVSLVYLDKPVTDSQTLYEPMYLIRGSSRIQSGYTVRFVQLVPAESGRFTQDLLNTSVAGARTLAQNKDNLQLDSFTPSVSVSSTATPTPTQIPDVENPITSTPTPTPTTFTPSPPPDPGPYCGNVPTGTINISLSVPGYGTLSLTAGHIPNGINQSPHTFFVQSALPNIDAAKIRNVLFQKVADQYIINIAKWAKGSQARLDRLKNEGGTLLAFHEINGSTTVKCTDVLDAARPAPLNCSDTLHREAIGMYSQVTKKVISLAQSNSLDAEAANADIFSPETNKNIQWVLSRNGGNTAGTERGCYISGASPVIFAYSPKLLVASLSTAAPVTYADPSLNNKTWSLEVSPRGIVGANGSTRDRLYYEFDKEKVEFKISNAGYIVRNKELSSLASKISDQLGLTPAESQALATEFTNAQSDLEKSEFIKVEFVNSQEVAKKLPLSISPAPDIIHRIHFVLSPAEMDSKIIEPKLQRLGRSGFTVIELGASSK